MKHILMVFVDNNPGVLRRVAGMFGRRGYNIDSLVVSATEDEAVSRMTIVVNGVDEVIEQVIKQLSKLEEVITVQDITKKEKISKQLLFLKVKADIKTRVDIITLVNVFRAKIVHMGKDSLIVESVGSSSKIDAIVESLRPFGILEIAKTGVIAMARESGEDSEEDED